jgi:DNA mismatch repair ATPase MutS
MGSHAKRITLLQNYIGSKRYLLEKFAQHFDLLSKENFESTLTIELNRESHEAKTELLLLASRSRALDLRLNLFATLLLNSTMLYDILCVYRLEQWREKNREHLGKWLKAIAEADALNSLASFAYNHPKFVTPEIFEDAELFAEDFGHPLIADENRICSNVEMDKNSNIWIVTGANMAGKSTFLRTVGVNVVLALTGSVVCASKMKCPIIEIYSGMRNTDSISENQSYFFAELLRLQGIIEKMKKGSKLFILLDEILKGTNSIDKLSGSQELVKQLTLYKCLAIIATHDVALGEMEKTYSSIKNFHFETFIEGDSLSFDYKLKSGVSTGKNATFLMRKMGIIPPT